MPWRGTARIGKARQGTDEVINQVENKMNETRHQTETTTITKAAEPWRPALNFIIEGLGTTNRYPTRDLYHLCGLDWAPTQKEGENAETFRRRFDRSRRLFAAYVYAMKRELGENLRVDLRATGEGAYEIVPHNRHVQTALRETIRDVRGALSEGIRRLDSFDVARASHQQLREHADASAHLDALRRMSNSRPKRRHG